MFCPHCGRENPDDAHNCVACGAQLPDLKEPDEFSLRVAEIARRDGKIAAIKFVRKEQRLGLKAAKEEVEAILDELGVDLPSSGGCLGVLLAAVATMGCCCLLWIWI